MKLHKLLRRHRGEGVKFRLDRWCTTIYFEDHGSMNCIRTNTGEIANFTPEEIMNKDWVLYEE